jgi:tight adherence protein B
MLALIGFCAFLTVTLSVIALARTVSAPAVALQGRIESIAGGTTAAGRDLSGGHLLRMQNYSTLPFLQHLLQGTARAERIGEQLQRAGLELRVGQYVVLSLVLGLLPAFVVVLLAPGGLRRIPLALIVFFLGLYAPRWYVKLRIRRRRDRFEAALPDALDMIARSLRSGSGLLAAIQNVIDQMDGPIAVELMRLQQEIATGLSIEGAFRDLDRRVDSGDLHIVVTAVIVQREVGGNLAEILGNVTGIMRERVRLRGEVKALVSRQVFSTYALAAAPPVIILALTLLGGNVFQSLFDEPAGRIVLGIATSLEIMGFLIVRKIAGAPIEV